MDYSGLLGLPLIKSRLAGGTSGLPRIIRGLHRNCLGVQVDYIGLQAKYYWLQLGLHYDFTEILWWFTLPRITKWIA